jgi:hypothetical protein
MSALVVERLAASRLLYLLAGGLIMSGVPLLMGGLRELVTGGGDAALLATWFGGLFLAGFVLLT